MYALDIFSQTDGSVEETMMFSDDIMDLDFPIRLLYKLKNKIGLHGEYADIEDECYGNPLGMNAFMRFGHVRIV